MLRASFDAAGLVEIGVYEEPRYGCTSGDSAGYYEDRALHAWKRPLALFGKAPA